MDIILIRGTGNSGKTTTASLVYQELLKTAKKEHMFDRSIVNKNGLQYHENQDVYDFIAILDVNGKIVVIISAGDWPTKLMKDIEDMIILVQNLYQVKIDVLICCGKTQNRENSVYIKLKSRFSNSNLTEVWPSWAQNKEDLEAVKQEAVRKIVSLIIS